VHTWKAARTRSGPFGLARRFETTLERHSGNAVRPTFIPIDAVVFSPTDRPAATLHAGDLFGEATAMLDWPRAATTRAMSEVVVLELPREAMFVLRQNPASRARSDAVFLDRTWPQHLARVDSIARLAGRADSIDELARRLRPHVRFRRYAPGDLVVQRGEPLVELRLVRFGIVEESRRAGNESHVANYIGPGGHLGGEALLQAIGRVSGEHFDLEADCTWRAITEVDVACVSIEALAATVFAMKEKVRAELDTSPGEAPGETAHVSRGSNSIDAVVLDHLARAERLVVIDLERCVHCNDCVRACGAAHGGVSRLVPDGLRLDDWLLPTTCITCLNPVCLIGCPVAAIERLPSREIAIADWCNGCGSCVERCPYGNLVEHQVARPSRERGAIDAVKPTLCDGCRGVTDGEPPCVAACAHEAIDVSSGSDFVGRTI
jgi:Fe-S-cluster-containing hydrogenase component 2/CRP-like cAMP-binding protein